jgi:hypothetical protein
LPGPIYIHCHHGKHRSPAAAAVACVVAGLISHEQALDVLRAAGTGENYRGLYQSVQTARGLDSKALDAMAANFPAAVAVPPIADAMGQIEHTYDHLKAFADAGWRPLASRPDLEPAHEALLLMEQYRELARTHEARMQPAAFRQLLAAAEQNAAQLEEALLSWQKAGGGGESPAGLRDLFGSTTNDCIACHQQFRDVPLAEKGR